MSEPSESKTPPQIITGAKSASTPPAAPPPQEFDLLAFWIQYRSVIKGCIYVAILGIVLWSVYLYMDARKKEGSELALAGAKTADELRKVTTDWAGTAAAATAHLRMADELRAAGKADEAAKEYQDFAAKNPTHPLVAGSIASLGLTLESAGKQEQALAAYQRIQSSYPKSAHMAVALMGIARIQAAQGKTDEAVKTLDALIQRSTPGNPFSFANEATRVQASLKNSNGKKTGGTPRPAPPEPPATPAPTPGAPNTPPTPPAATTPAPATPAPATPAPAPATPAPATPAPAAGNPPPPAAPAPEAPKTPEPTK